MNFKSISLLLGTILSLVVASPVEYYPKKSYQGYQVIRFQVSTQEQLERLAKELEENPLELDQWSTLRIGHVDVNFAPSFQAKSSQILADIPHEVWIGNLQDFIIRDENYSREMSDSPEPKAFFSDYQTTEKYMEYLLALPGTTEFSIGKSYEGRPIRGVSFGKGNITHFFNGGVHAREWISPSTTVFIADWLLSSDPKAKQMLQKFTFHVIPVVNVDGYEYARSSDRLWRKNREPNQGNKCVGTDINRNFGFKWGKRGASSNPCAQDFYGSGPFSTKEARALQDYIGSLKNVLTYIDFHSYSQLWLYAWGWTCDEKAPDNDDFVAISNAATNAVRKLRGTTFEVQRSCQLYVTSGTTEENFYTSFGIKYGMTVELPDTGKNGFVLPASEIIPVGKETLEGMLVYWEYASTHPKILYHSS